MSPWASKPRPPDPIDVYAWYGIFILTLLLAGGILAWAALP